MRTPQKIVQTENLRGRGNAVSGVSWTRGTLGRPEASWLRRTHFVASLMGSEIFFGEGPGHTTGMFCSFSMLHTSVVCGPVIYILV